MCGSTFPINFPNLNSSNYFITSKPTRSYNCIAWAAGEINRWWEPDDAKQYFWPEKAPREFTISAYIAAFSTIGYEECQTGIFEKRYEKVAIYGLPLAMGIFYPTHAARQLKSGAWISKLGAREDIEHNSELVLRGPAYGEIVKYLRREWLSI